MAKKNKEIVPDIIVASKVSKTLETVIEKFKANINNHEIIGNVGDEIELTPTEYNVLKRFLKG